MKWEEYEPGSAKQTAYRVHVSFNQKGNIYLNGKALETLGNPEFVVLMYDRQQRAVGIAAATAGHKNAIRLNYKETGRSRARVVYAATFFQLHRIRPRGTIAFVAPPVDRDGVMTLVLDKAIPSLRKAHK